MNKALLLMICIVQLSFANDNFYYQNSQKIYLTPENNSLRNTSSIDYYQTDKGVTLGVTNKLILKLSEDNNLEAIITKYDLVLVKELSKNLYLVKVPNKDLTIDTANILNENSEVEYAQPDFIKQRFSR